MTDYHLTDKRRMKASCFPKKLHRIKSNILGKNFPSKISLRSRDSSLHEEDFGESRFSTGSELTQHCADKAEISFWRIANCEDVETILDLTVKFGHVTEELFSPPDVPDLIEKSAFALAQFNTLQEMVSFTCVFAYPNIPAIPSFDWYVCLQAKYLIDDMTPRNCFFVHYMIWKPVYYEDFLAPTLETLFMEFPFLKYIVIVRPPMVKIPELLGDYFIPIFPNDIHKYKWDSGSVQTLLLCLRHSMLERLKIRLAMVEDHDDLMPIIERQTNKLRELYGDFCMAEIIEYPGTDDRKTLVCEVMGYAVAFMNLTRAIDLELLNTQFDLGVFHGLRKPTEEDKNAEILPEGQENVVHLPETLSSTLDIVNSDTLDLVLNWRPVICQTDQASIEDSSGSSSDGDLPTTMVNLIKESMDAKVKHKFTAYALGSAGANSQNSYYSSQPGEVGSSPKTDLSLISLQYFNLPEYHGPPNAFCIELFAIHEDFDEKLCSDFLEAAFELFPDLDYCLLTIPSQCFTFPLLDLFVRVTPRPLKRFKQELYVCHRSSVMITFMRVRKMLKSDMAEIQKLLQGIKNREFIYADMANSCIYPDSAYGGYVLICNKSIVGAAVVCYEDGLEYLTEHYHVSDLIDFDLHKIDSHAVLKHLTLSPIYQTHARFFLRDVMRMADLTALYRARYEESQTSHSTTSLITVLGHFVPIKPRRMIKYHTPSLGENLPPSHLLSEDIPFALYHINSRICGLPKFTSNIHLVIVGSSRTAFSFLENLLYAPSSAYVTYTNISWVSPHGPGFDVPSHPARDLMFPYRGKYDTRYRSQISLHTFVNIIYGVMTEINRVDKYITINYDAIVRYDILVLLCGKQHLMPAPAIRELDFTRCNRGNRSRCSLFKWLTKQKVDQTENEKIVYPSNVLMINTTIDATNALITVQYLLEKRKKKFDADEKIIIYGQELRVFTCIQSLLKFGVPPEIIVLVEPIPKHISPENVFKDPNVDLAVKEILQDLKIEHYRNFDLYDWEFCSNNQIRTATFHSTHRKIILKVMAMFPFEEKLVSDVTFRAVNEASLVYDGRLVINSRFQTNDPFIYSAGPFTKYQRKYHADEKNHEYYNSTEAGKLLSEVIREKIDPTKEDKKVSEDEEAVPIMKKPILVAAQLPGDWNYFHLRKPGKYVPLEITCNLKEFGDSLITGDCKMRNGYGYFRIHLDDFGFVRSITCFTKDEIDVENLTILYGKHEKCLNNLLIRFNLGMITDFFAYFRQPWAYALYHDKFKNLMEANEQLLERESIKSEPEILRLINDAFMKNKYDKLYIEKLNYVMDVFDSSLVKEKMIRNILLYLQAYDYAFPMYASPRILRMLLQETNTSILHKSFLRGIDSVYQEYKSSIQISDLAYKL